MVKISNSKCEQINANICFDGCKLKCFVKYYYRKTREKNQSFYYHVNIQLLNPIQSIYLTAVVELMIIVSCFVFLLGVRDGDKQQVKSDRIYFRRKIPEQIRKKYGKINSISNRYKSFILIYVYIYPWLENDVAFADVFSVEVQINIVVAYLEENGRRWMERERESVSHLLMD